MWTLGASIKIYKRPAEVDAYAERLGVSLSEGLIQDQDYRARYLNLNSYEDPVYNDLYAPAEPASLIVSS